MIKGILKVDYEWLMIICDHSRGELRRSELMFTFFVSGFVVRVVSASECGLCFNDEKRFVEEAPKQSPALYHHAIGFEYSIWLRLGEIVGCHLVGRTLNDLKLLSIVGIPEPMEFSQ